MNNNESSSGVIVGIIIVLVIGIIAFLAYNQGFFKAKTQDQNTGGVQIKVGGSSGSSNGAGY